MIAIYKRELKSYFQSMIGYAFVAFVMLFTGIYFTAYNLQYGDPSFANALTGSMLIFLVAVPILTMKCFAEERKSKTDQLLLTAPVSVTSIVVGKFLAMVTVFLVPILIDCLYPLIIKSQGTAYLKTDYVVIFLYFLVGCAYIAIGMFLSALTESQIIAAVSTFAVLLVLYLWNGIIGFLPSAAKYNMVGVLVILFAIGYLIYALTKNWLISVGVSGIGMITSMIIYFVNRSAFEGLLSNVLGKLAFASVLSEVAYNKLLDVSSLVLCISIVFLFVFLTIQMIQKRRWS